jgi:hypothetical protein
MLRVLLKFFVSFVYRMSTDSDQSVREENKLLRAENKRLCSENEALKEEVSCLRTQAKSDSLEVAALREKVTFKLFVFFKPSV